MYRLHYLAIAAFTADVITAGTLGAQTGATKGPRVVSYAIDAKPPAYWTVAAKPLVEVGGADGKGPTEFTRITGAARQRDGTIVVANGATGELRFFNARGGFLRSTSRRGAGPGEFRDGPELLVSVSDTLVASDSRLGVLVFAPNGKFLRALTFPVVPGYVRNPPVGAFSAWDVVIYMRRGKDGPAVMSASLDSLWLGRVSLRDTSVRVLLGQRSAPLYAKGPGVRPIYSFGFAPRTLNAVGRGRVCTGYPDRYEVLCSDSLGHPLFKIVRDVLTRPVSDSARRAFRDNTAGRRPDGTSQYEGSLREHREQVAASAKFADHYPAYSRLLISQTGDLWVRAFATADGLGEADRLNSSSTSTTWSIYNVQGAWIADCTLPPHFSPAEIGANYVLGVSRDEDDVERITLLSLTSAR
jgi:hypothetical protein